MTPAGFAYFEEENSNISKLQFCPSSAAGFYYFEVAIAVTTSPNLQVQPAVLYQIKIYMQCLPVIWKCFAVVFVTKATLALKFPGLT